jgi:hypothetical protein
MQGRALGARIAGVLRAREEEVEDTKTSGANGTSTGQKRKRKHRIIIHSSPFTRCIQTSIAIGAGIAQFKGRAPSTARHQLMHSGSPHIQALENSPRLAAIPEPAEDLPPAPLLPDPSSQPSKPEATSTPSKQPTSTPSKPISSFSRKNKAAELRIDAFLGEWLSPDYFENITPPPSSVMMVASAKAELLRPGETIEGSNPGRSMQGNFPGGWSVDWSPADSSGDEAAEDKSGLADMASLGQALPNRARSSTTASSDSPVVSLRRNPGRLNTNLLTDNAYVPPTPTYAISSSDAIPVGYVAHARDACISVSYAWDSMRPPQSWGNGGEYGEEWSAMHRRFRNGLGKLIEWYEEHGTAVNRTQEMLMRGQEEEEEDTVVILVTHGAGCNALLGALTNQPVLLDVGMASLTMAVRKEGAKSARERRRESEEENSATRKNSRRGSIDLGIAEDYKMKFTASTEHLRGGSNPLSASTVSPRLGPMGSGAPYRRPATSFSGDNFSIGEGASLPAGRPMTANAATSGGGGAMSWAAGGGAGGLNRSVSSGNRGVYHPSLNSSSAPRVSSGLWRSGMMMERRRTGSGTESGGESDSLPNFGNTAAKTTATVSAMPGKGGGTAAAAGMDGVSDANSGDALSRIDSNVAPDMQPPRKQQEQQEVNGNTDTNSNSAGTTASELLSRTPSHTPTRTATAHPAPSSMGGLWGSSGFASARDGGREKTFETKRRWTVVEKGAG